MKLSLATCGAALLLASSLNASTITLTGVDTARGANMSFNNNGTVEAGFAGVVLATFDGVDVSPLFCVDLFTNIDLATYSSAPLAPRLARHEDRVAWLYLNQVNTVTSPDTGLAFQIAIWDIVHDGGDGFATGLIQSGATSLIGLTQTQIDLANLYLAASAGRSVTTGISIYENFSLTGVPAQSLIGVLAPGGNAPEPSTLAMAALGVIGLVAGGCRRPRQN